jgi:hypothetical protein
MTTFSSINSCFLSSFFLFLVSLYHFSTKATFGIAVNYMLHRNKRHEWSIIPNQSLFFHIIPYP